MPRLLEQTTVKLHAVGDQLWCADGDHAPLRLDPVRVLDHSMFQRAGAVRLLGTPANAPWIVRLHESHLRGQSAPVEVGSPRMLRGEVAPPAILIAMRQCLEGLSASLGGWHTVTAVDYATYRLWLDGRDHPLLRSLGFIGHLQRPRVLDVLRAIGDPRWHLSRRNPSSPGALHVYLGLTPERMATALRGGGGSREARGLAVVESWRQAWERRHVDCDPGYFLWRDWEAYRQRGREPWFAALRTSQRFLVMLRGLWLDLLKGPHVHDAFFSPDAYFRQPREAAAFRAYQAHAGCAEGASPDHNP